METQKVSLKSENLLASVNLRKITKHGDCLVYTGIHLLSNSTIVATTYANYRKEDVGCSIVSVRFTMNEVDAMAKNAE